MGFSVQRSLLLLHILIHLPPSPSLISLPISLPIPLLPLPLPPPLRTLVITLWASHDPNTVIHPIIHLKKFLTSVPFLLRIPFLPILIHRCRYYLRNQRELRTTNLRMLPTISKLTCMPLIPPLTVCTKTTDITYPISLHDITTCD